MTYISSASYAGKIDAIRLITMDTYQANDFKLHTLKRQFLLSRLGEISNEIDRLEADLVVLVERKQAGLAKHSDIGKQKDKISSKIAYRENIMRGLSHEDNFLAKFGENKPYIKPNAYGTKLEVVLSGKPDIEYLKKSRKCMLSRFGEICDVLYKIERLMCDAKKANDEVRMKQLTMDHQNYSTNRTNIMFYYIDAIDRKIDKLKK
jgi:hypothetical protein